MRQKPITIISSMLMALGLMFSGNQLRAQLGASDPGPLNLTVALTGSSTISLGEPILLKYVVKNTSRQKASVYTADVKHTSLITERFTDAMGKPLIPSVNPILPRHSAMIMTGWEGLEVAGSTSASWESVANAYVNFPRPGRYILRVHVQNPYVISDIDQGDHYLLSGDYAFPLTVVQTNAAYLRVTAERLRQRILATHDVNTKAMLIKALFSMPEVTASASWQALIEEPKLEGYFLSQIGTTLARIHTIRAADILAEMIWEAAQPRDAQYESVPEKHLYEMYDTGDAALRKHIEELHKQHGVEMSHYRLE